MNNPEKIMITLAAARVNAGMTIEQACEKLKVSKNTMIKWEKGIKCPPWNKVMEISELYQFPYDHIIFLKKESA